MLLTPSFGTLVSRIAVSLGPSESGPKPPNDAIVGATDFRTMTGMTWVARSLRVPRVVDSPAFGVGVGGVGVVGVGGSAMDRSEKSATRDRMTYAFQPR
jgi:hypothetical protein